MARGGHGDVPVQRGRADRGAFARSRPQRHPRPAGPGPRDRHAPATRRHVARGAGRAIAARRHRARAARRTHRRRRRDRQRPLGRGPVAHHRRKPAGGKGRGRPGLRRHGQRLGLVRIPRHRRRRQHHACPHHPCRGAGPGRARADAALHRPLLAHLYAGGGGRGRAGGRGAAAAVEPALVRRHLPRAGAADHRLPLRAGDLHAGKHRQRPDCRGAASWSRAASTSKKAATAMAGAGQDRHPDPRQAGADRPAGLGTVRPEPPARGAGRRQPGGAFRPPRVAGRGQRGARGRPSAAGRGRLRRPCPAVAWPA